MQQAERSYDLNKAAELKYGKLPKLREELAKAEADMRRAKRTACFVTASPRRR